MSLVAKLQDIMHHYCLWKKVKSVFFQVLEVFVEHSMECVTAK